MIEDTELRKSSLGLYFDAEKARDIYTETEFGSEETKLEELRVIRENHEKESFRLLAMFKEIIS